MTALATQSDISRGIESDARCYPHTFGQVYSGGRYQVYRWVRYVGVEIGKAITRGGARIIVNIRPRSGKSRLISHWTPLWFLDQWPEKKVMLVANTEPLAKEFGRDARNEFERNPALCTRLRQDSQSASRWHTDESGGMLCAGIGGAIVGFGFDLGIIEDPCKNWQEAYSRDTQLQQREWFLSTFLTRAEPGASIVIVMQRWHEDDLCGWLMSEMPGVWDVIRLPAVAEAGDPLGREIGEPVCPERFDAETQEQQRIAVGQEVFDAMYQQAPRAVRGGRTYDHFTPALNVSGDISLRPDLPLNLAVDFNINPGMHLVVGQYHGASDVFSWVHEIHGPRMNVEHATDALIELIAQLGGWKWPELHVFGDATGSSEWVGTSESMYQVLFRGLRKLGPKVLVRRRVPKANPPVIDRVHAVNDALRDVQGVARMFIHPRCVRLIDDFKSMRPGEDGLEDKSDRKLSHASSAVGYCVNYLRPLRSRTRREPARFSVRV